jgi:hypothetical protein
MAQPEGPVPDKAAAKAIAQTAPKACFGCHENLDDGANWHFCHSCGARGHNLCGDNRFNREDHFLCKTCGDRFPHLMKPKPVDPPQLLEEAKPQQPLASSNANGANGDHKQPLHEHKDLKDKKGGTLLAACACIASIEFACVSDVQMNQRMKQHL